MSYSLECGCIFRNFHAHSKVLFYDEMKWNKSILQKLYFCGGFVLPEILEPLHQFAHAFSLSDDSGAGLWSSEDDEPGH